MDHNAEARAAARLAGHGPGYATYTEIRRYRWHVADQHVADQSTAAEQIEDARAEEMDRMRDTLHGPVPDEPPFDY